MRRYIMASETQITKKQDSENTKILEKQSFEKMQDLLSKVAQRGSSNLEIFQISNQFLRETLKHSPENKQQAFLHVIKNMEPKARAELVAELKREKEKVQEIKVAQQPKQQEEKKDVNKYIKEKLAKDETLASFERVQLEKHLEQRGEAIQKRMKTVVSKYEGIRDELIGKADILLEKSENGTATKEDKKNLDMCLGLLNEVHIILNTIDLEKAGEITGSSTTKGSGSYKFAFIGSQFENAVLRTFIDAQNSFGETITSLENISSDMEKLAKGLGSKQDMSTILTSREKNYASLERNVNYLLSSIDTLKYQEGVAEGAYGEVRNFAVQSAGAVASLGVSSIFLTAGTSVSSMVAVKGLIKGVEIGADYAVGATSTYYGTGKFDLEDAAKQATASASSALKLRGVSGTHIKQLAVNSGKFVTRVYSNVIASTIETEVKIENSARVMEAD